MSELSEFGSSRNFALDERDVLAFVFDYFSAESFAGTSVLDVGCRVGEFSAALTRLGANVTGIDLSEACIDEARSRSPGVRFKVMDVRDLSELPARSYDVILCLGVMCYLKPAEWLPALAQMGRLCKENGRLLVLFQRDNSRFAKAAVVFANLLPATFYSRIVCPVAAAVFAPLSRFLLGKKIDATAFRYRVLVSMRGLHFGFPSELGPWERPTKTSNYASSKTTASFLLSRQNVEAIIGRQL